MRKLPKKKANEYKKNIMMTRTTTTNTHHQKSVSVVAAKRKVRGYVTFAYKFCGPMFDKILKQFILFSDIPFYK